MAIFNEEYIKESFSNNKKNNLIILNTSNKNLFDKLYKNEALTAEGFFVKNEEMCDKVAEWFRKNNKCTSNTLDIYDIPSKVMNDFYHLTENNRYPDDIHICCIDWIKAGVKGDIYKSNWRWFSDVVDNNAKREIIKKNPYYKHYYSIYYGNIGWSD